MGTDQNSGHVSRQKAIELACFLFKSFLTVEACLIVHLSVRPSLPLSLSLSAWLSVCLSVWLAGWQSAHAYRSAITNLDMSRCVLTYHVSLPLRTLLTHLHTRVAHVYLYLSISLSEGRYGGCWRWRGPSKCSPSGHTTNTPPPLS